MAHLGVVSLAGTSWTGGMSIRLHYPRRLVVARRRAGASIMTLLAVDFRKVYSFTQLFDSFLFNGIGHVIAMTDYDTWDLLFQRGSG